MMQEKQQANSSVDIAASIENPKNNPVTRTERHSPSLNSSVEFTDSKAFGNSNNALKKSINSTKTSNMNSTQQTLNSNSATNTANAPSVNPSMVIQNDTNNISNNKVSVSEKSISKKETQTIFPWEHSISSDNECIDKDGHLAIKLSIHGGSLGLNAIEFDLPGRSAVVLRSAGMPASHEQYPMDLNERQLRSYLRPGMEIIEVNGIRLLPASLDYAKRLISLTAFGEKTALKFDMSVRTLVRQIYTERMPVDTYFDAFGLFCQNKENDLRKIGKISTSQLRDALKSDWQNVSAEERAKLKKEAEQILIEAELKKHDSNGTENENENEHFSPRDRDCCDCWCIRDFLFGDIKMSLPGVGGSRLNGGIQSRQSTQSNDAVSSKSLSNNNGMNQDLQVQRNTNSFIPTGTQQEKQSTSSSSSSSSSSHAQSQDSIHSINLSQGYYPGSTDTSHGLQQQVYGDMNMWGHAPTAGQYVYNPYTYSANAASVYPNATPNNPYTAASGAQTYEYAPTMQYPYANTMPYGGFVVPPGGATDWATPPGGYSGLPAYLYPPTRSDADAESVSNSTSTSIAQQVNPSYGNNSEQNNYQYPSTQSYSSGQPQSQQQWNSGEAEMDSNATHHPSSGYSDDIDDKDGGSGTGKQEKKKKKRGRPMGVKNKATYNKDVLQDTFKSKQSTRPTSKRQRQPSAKALNRFAHDNFKSYARVSTSKQNDMYRYDDDDEDEDEDEDDERQAEINRIKAKLTAKVKAAKEKREALLQRYPPSSIAARSRGHDKAIRMLYHAHNFGGREMTRREMNETAVPTREAEKALKAVARGAKIDVSTLGQQSPESAFGYTTSFDRLDMKRKGNGIGTYQKSTGTGRIGKAKKNPRNLVKKQMRRSHKAQPLQGDEDYNWAQCEDCKKWRGLGYGNPWVLPHFMCKLIARNCSEQEDTLTEGEIEKNAKYRNLKKKQSAQAKNKIQPKRKRRRTKKEMQEVKSKKLSESEESESEESEESESEESEESSDSSESDSSYVSSSSDENENTSSDENIYSDYISGDEEMGDVVIHSSKSATTRRKKTYSKLKAKPKPGTKPKPKPKPKPKLKTTSQQLQRPVPNKQLPKGWKQDLIPTRNNKNKFNTIYWSPDGKKFTTIKEAQKYVILAKKKTDEMNKRRAAKATKLGENISSRNSNSSSSSTSSSSSSSSHANKANVGSKRSRSIESSDALVQKQNVSYQGLNSRDIKPSETKRRRTSTFTRVLVCQSVNGSAFEEGILLSSDGRKKYAVQMRHSKASQLVSEYRIIFIVEGSHQGIHATNGSTDIGKTIVVYWPDDLTWYGAKVVDYRPPSKSPYTHFVRYHDGETGWLNMSREQFVWVLADSQLREHERYVFCFFLFFYLLVNSY